jgi:hypothetical protein
VENSYSQFTHLLGDAFNPDTGGPLWGQQDGNPCGEFYEMAAWPPGSIVMSKVNVPIPQQTPAGEYQLQTGFYNWQTGDRVPLQNGAEGNVSLGTIRVENVE